jgi:hypothetical protein
VLGGRRPLAQSHLFDQASAEQRIARVRCLVLHPFIHFLCPEQLLVIGERTAHPLTDNVQIFALKREDARMPGPERGDRL